MLNFFGYLITALFLVLVAVIWNNAKKAEEKDRVKHGMGGKDGKTD